MISATLNLDEAAKRRWDVVVIGAGPSGATAARQIARRGAGVLLLDRCSFPRDKVCGCCLSLRAIEALRRMDLGHIVQQPAAMPLDRLYLTVDRRRATLRLPGGAVMSRSALDAVLIEAALDAGAAFLPRTSATLGDVRGDQRIVSLRTGKVSANVAARVVIAASGLVDRLALRSTDIATHVAPRARLGAGVIVEDAPAEYAAGAIYMSVSAEGYVGMVRLEDNRLDVAAALDAAAITRQGGMGAVAASIVRRAGLPPVHALEQLPWRGTPGLTRRPSGVAAERLLVVGDAAGYVEPFTGEGIACALDGGWAVSPLAWRGLQNWSMAIECEWSDVYRSVVGRRQLLCRCTSAVLRRHGLARMLVRVLSAAPALADPFIRRLNVGPAKYTFG